MDEGTGGCEKPTGCASSIKWAEWITDAAAERDVFAYFNNDAQAHAVDDARTLKALTEHQCR